MGTARDIVRTAAAIMVVLGILFGPGYYLFQRYLNGRVTGSVDMSTRAERWQFADGSIQRFRGRLAHTPIALELDPARNRAILVLTFEMSTERRQDAPANLYLATLLDQDHPALQREIRVDASAGRQQRVVFPPYVVRTPGTHLFLLEELNRAPRPVARVSLTLREQADPYLRQLVGIGLGLSIAGSLLFVHDRFTAQGQRR